MKSLLTILSVFIGISALSQSQSELKMKIKAFSSDLDSAYEKSVLNIAKRDIGAIYDTYPDFFDEFVIEAKEKKENNLGYNSRYEYYLAFFGYETETDLNYAMKDWLKEFIEDQQVRPGREMRKYEYGEPTIIIINKTSIGLLTFDCKQYDVQMFREWRSKMLSYFGDENSVVIELLCDGPLQWTKNPPDPKDRTWK